ncbi:MAG: hypothetical protein ACREAD_04295 [Nitrosopumilaceae archaeon]
MSIQADAVTLKKLVLAKQLFHRALIQSNSLSNIDKIMSVIMFDLATETTLNSIISSLDPQKTASDGFPSLLNQVDDLISKKGLGNIPDRANIIHVHNIRNDAQHDARYPNNSEISDCQTYTRDFLQKISLLIWNLDFDRISMADLIQNQKIQTYLKKAENALLNKDYKITVEQSVIGFEKTLNYVGRAIVGSAYFSSSSSIVVSDSFGRDPKPDRNLTNTIEKMSDTLRLVSLGLNLLDYKKFKVISGEPLFSIGNEDPVDFHDTKENLTQDDAEFAFAYAVDSILMVESRVGDIEKPFGKDYLSWY